MTDCAHTHIKCQECFRDIEPDKLLGPPPLQEALVRIQELEAIEILNKEEIQKLHTRIRFLELSVKEIQALTHLMVGVVSPEEENNGYTKKL